MTKMVFSLIFFLVSLLIAGALGQDSGLKLRESDVVEGAKRVWALIDQEVTRSGGNLEHQNLRFIVAFGTSYFKSDPLKAQAARALAAELTRNKLAPGDTLEVYAFEYGIWPHRPEGVARLSVTGRGQSLGASLEGLFPTTPQQGSLGGQDPERAIVDLLGVVGGSRDVVILLISNTAAPLARPGIALIGSNDPEYLRALEGWRRVPGTKDGASLEVSYSVERKDQLVAQHKLDLILLVPASFSGAPLAEPRCQLLGTCVSPQDSATKDQRPGRGSFAPVVGLLVLVLVLAAVFLGPKFLRPRRYVAEVEGVRLPLAGLEPGQALGTLVGRGFQGEVTGHKWVLRNAPPVEVARLIKDGRGLKVEAIELRLATVNGEPSLNERLQVQDGAEYQLVFEGEVIDERRIPRHYSVETRVRFEKEG
jgi:hypothetical protein